jgi:caa(3)-type oxidase subunit IV
VSDREQNIAALWKGPAIAWLVLLLLFALSLGSAYLPLGTGNVAVSLALALLMLGILVTFLMDLQNATTLLRIIAGTGLFWTAIMFTLTFCDYFSRHY